MFFLLVVARSPSQCFTSTSAGYANSVGLKPDGSIWGWGSGVNGTLNNTTDFDEYSPVLLSNLNSWQFIKNYYFNTFAIKTDGTLWSCGYNLFGLLGVGSTSNIVESLTQVGTASNWKYVVSSGSQSIGMKTDNSLWGWGQNDFYQVGNGSCCGNVLSPVLVSSATDWKSIAVSRARSSFAIKTNGTIWGWGQNISGLLGISTITVRQAPTQLNSDTDWRDMSVGFFHILVLKTNNTLWSWGENANGERGFDPANVYDPSVRTQMPGSNWSKVAAGIRFSLGIKTDGTLWAWGKNDVGQLGDGTTMDRFVPVQIGTDTNWNTISAGWQHVVATKTDGSLWTWGTNDVGQLGNGTTSAVALPTIIPIAGCTLANASFNLELNALVLSPNPAANEFTVRYKGLDVVNKVVVYDLSGRLVYESNAVASSAFSATIGISELQSGSYLVVLKNNEKTIVSKQLVKE